MDSIYRPDKKWGPHFRSQVLNVLQIYCNVNIMSGADMSRDSIIEGYNSNWKKYEEINPSL